MQQIINQCEALGLYLEWNTGSFSIKLPDPQGSGLKIGILNIDRSGQVYLGYSKGQFEKLQLPPAIAHRFASNTATLLHHVQPRSNKPQLWNRPVSLHEIRQVYPRFHACMNQYIAEITQHLQQTKE